MNRVLTTFVVAISFAAFAAARDVSIPSPQQDANSTLQRLVDGQRTLDRLAWGHRLWPDSNPSPKPPFEQTVPNEASRTRVVDTLRLLNALTAYWHDPLTATERERELQRMVTSSKDPARLAERFRALDDDPFLVYALIVDPVLASAKARLAFERDPRSFAGERARLTLQLTNGEDRFAGARWQHVERTRIEDETWDEERSAADTPPQLALTADQSSLELKESLEFFYVRLNEVSSPTANSYWEASWPKPRFDAWWAQNSTRFDVSVPALDGPSVIPSLQGDSACVPGTWEYIASNPPDPRAALFHVWTGTELLVWGGANAGSTFGTGGRYDPTTDTWSQISSGTGAPSSRVFGTAVWTGTEMIVWGGESSFSSGFGLVTGARYNPTLDSWTATSTIGAPTARYRHAAVWTGSEMIVWGGRSRETGNVQTGARYNPVSDTWTPTAIDANTPSPRTRPAVVWTGQFLFVWGGVSGAGYDQVGALYNPVLDNWQPTSIAGAPVGRDGSLAVSTGSEVLVWGGTDGVSMRSDGGRYLISTNTWLPIPAAGLLSGRWFHAQVWTGSKMLVWGGGNFNLSVQYGDGGSYDPSSNSWEPIVGDASVMGPSSRLAYAWSGTELLVWGGDGEGAGSTIGGRGGRYNPVTRAWTSMGGRGLAPGRRFDLTEIWDGVELIVWGGADATTSGGYACYSDGFTFDPATNAWSPIETTGAPSARRMHSSIWTGRELIVWGGRGDTGPPFGDGARFDPATRTWSAIPVSATSPSARSEHTATWTGAEMVVWGGDGNTGGRYRPSDGVWTPMAVTASTPFGRTEHSAVWDGVGVIIYGGAQIDLANGSENARYVPSTDTWTPLAIPPQPGRRRRSHAAAWGGDRMLVWGGRDNDLGAATATGLSYNPLSDAWTVLGAGSDLPSARYAMQYGWDGESLIIWGGHNFPSQLVMANGSRYVSATDSWQTMNAASGVPEARQGNVGVFSGTRWYLWGGGAYGNGIGQGASFCRCAGTQIYRDTDGDGYGNPLLTQPSCVVPTGYVTTGGDCDDSNNTVHPGALELCDLLDNNCDQIVDNVVAPAGVQRLMVLPTQILWDPEVSATTYDVQRGEVSSLLASSGDYTSAKLTCVANDVAATSVTDIFIPATGGATFYLSRGQNCGGSGSYDEPTGGQSGSRDAEIAASIGACP